MKIKLHSLRHREQGLGLAGVIVGIVVIIVGAVLIYKLIQLCRLLNHPRQLPPDERGQTPPTNAPETISVLYIPAALDLVTPEPQEDHAKVLIDNSCLVQCSVGSLTNWSTMFYWTLGDFGVYSNRWGTVKMREDYSSFDIKFSDEKTNMVFWRTVTP